MLRQTDFFQDIAKILDFAICVYVFQIIGKFSALFITVLIILVFEVLLYKQSLNTLNNVKVRTHKHTHTYRNFLIKGQTIGFEVIV